MSHSSGHMLLPAVHVLVVPSWYPTQSDDISGSFFREQARALAQAQMRVGVVAPLSVSLRQPRRWRNSSKDITYANEDGVPTLRQTSVEWLGRVPPFGIAGWVERGLRMFDAYCERFGAPDVVHAHCLLNAGCLALEINKRTGIPYVATEHSTSYARKLVPAWKLKRAAEAARSAAARIAVSEPLVDVLGGVLGLGSGAWQVIPNIVDGLFTEVPLVKRKRTGFRFASVGLLTPKKGHDVLIRAFAAAFRGNPDVSLSIAGGGPLLVDLRTLADSLGVGERIEFMGNMSRTQVRDLLLASDAFALASHVETFGVVVAEALAMGLPVVATRSGGPESIVTHSDGILVPAGDVEATSRALLDIFSRVDEFVPQDLRGRCVSRFSGGAIADQLRDVYRAAISNRRVV